MKGRTNAVSNDGVKPLITTIRINQNISDPSTMITLIEDTGAIQAIRSNSHRYLAKKTAEGKMAICQLDDYNSNYYYNGDIADLTGACGDVYMRLPHFFYRGYEVQPNVWDITFCYSEYAPDSTYQEWVGNDLIAVYEAWVDNDKAWSLPGRYGQGMFSYDVAVELSENRGAGFSLIKAEHHNIMAFLYLAQYRHTNCQLMIGAGAVGYNNVLGRTTELGMQDTKGNGGNGDNNSINFWGLENWWGNRYEWIGEVALNKVAGDKKLTINGNREIEISSEYTYISKMVIGKHLDAFALACGASATTGYCDVSLYASAKDRRALRSGNSNDADNGVFYVNLVVGSTDTSDAFGARIAYRGAIENVTNVNEFKNLIML